MEFFERLEAVRERWNVLRHPFYQRWERGELAPEELADYAAEYRHAVAALARTAAKATALAGPEHAAQEGAHVELWDEFAVAVGARPDGEPRPETRECVRAWTAAADALEALAILYAIESAQPEIARTKLAGLVEHYGLAEDSPATAYFALHAQLDHLHAGHSRGLLEERATEADTERLVGVAEAALRGNWTLLDGVER